MKNENKTLAGLSSRIDRLEEKVNKLSSTSNNKSTSISIPSDDVFDFENNGMPKLSKYLAYVEVDTTLVDTCGERRIFLMPKNVEVYNKKFIPNDCLANHSVLL